MTRQPKTLGICTKSAAATHGFRRRPKKLPLPKCSTNTSSEAYISKKGCYPGQEIIARAQYRGQVKRGLAVLRGDSLEAAGVAVQNGGEEAGQIINTALTDTGSLSLAVIKFSAAHADLTDADGNDLKQETLFFTVDA